MTELKAGTRGTWVPRKTPATLICDGPDRFGQLAIKDADGEYCVIDEADFTPDPEPPTTVMVKIPIGWAQRWATGDRFDHGDDELVAANAAKALREVGL